MNAVRGENWYFSNPKNENKREQLRREAEEDLKRHLAASQQGRAPSKTQLTPNITNTPQPNTGQRAGRSGYQPATPLANPLLGLGEKDLHRDSTRRQESQDSLQEPEATRSSRREEDASPKSHERRQRRDGNQEQQDSSRRQLAQSRDREIDDRGPPRREKSRGREDEGRVRHRYDDDRYGDDYGENDREYRRPTRRSFRSRFYDDEDEEDDRYYQEERRRRRSPNGRRLSDDYEGSTSDLRMSGRQDRPPHHVKYAEERRSYDDRPHYRAQNNEDDRKFREEQNAAKKSIVNFPGHEETERRNSEKASKANQYAEDLKKQMASKRERDNAEKEKRMREDMKLEQAAMAYNPFGKGGAGAPLRDQYGEIITNTKMQAKINAISPPAHHVAMSPVSTQSPQQTYAYQEPSPTNFRQPPGGATSVSILGSTSPDATSKAEMERIRKEKYLKDLEQQVQMRKEREEREKAKLQAEDRRKEMEIEQYNPWGKVGAGAPLLDRDGKVIPKTTAFQKQIEAPIQPQYVPPNSTFNPSMPSSDPNQLLAQLTSMLMATNQNNSVLSNPLLSQLYQPQVPTTNGIETLLRQFMSQSSSQPSSLNPNAAPSSQLPQQGTYSPMSPQADANIGHGAGAVDLEKLPLWQREEALRKQKQFAVNQESLKNQIEEKKRLKELELQKEKERERLEEEKIERERRELEERYQRESAGPPIPTLAGKKGTVDKPLQQNKNTTGSTVVESSSTLDTSKKAPVGADAVQRYLQAQAEAEELKKNKFRHKKVNPVDDGRNDGAQSAEVYRASPPVQAVRSSSPPLPALRKKTDEKMQSIDSQSMTQGEPRSSDSRETPFVERPASQRVQSASKSQTQLPVSENKTSSPNFSGKYFEEKKPSEAEMDYNTKAVLDQLSAIKLDLERERQQIENDIKLRKSVRSGKNTPEVAQPQRVVEKERVTAPMLKVSERLTSNSESTGSPILDRILANIRSASERQSNLPSPKNDIEKILQRQEHKLAQQEDSLFGINRSRPEKKLETEETQLQSTSTHVSVGNELMSADDGLIQSYADSNIVRRKSARPISGHSFEPVDLLLQNSLSKHEPVAVADVGRASPASTLDLEALERLNESRMKRISTLRQNSITNSSKQMSDHDLIDQFLSKSSDLLVDTVVK